MSDIGYCVECNARVSVKETRALGSCPACGDDFPMLTDQPKVETNANV